MLYNVFIFLYRRQSLKRKIKKKEWLRRRQTKIMRRKQRKKKNHYKTMSNSGNTGKRRNRMMIKAPSVFSLIQNREETIDVFNQVFEIINGCSLNDIIFFDLSEIELVTPDAIMFLIAIMNNTRRLKVLKVTCSGNLPNDKTTRSVFEKVGFYDYVRAMRKNSKTKDPDRLRILHGQESNSEVVASICDFVIEKSNLKTTVHTRKLYKMLIELMTNVKQHAYNIPHGTMIANWYVYVENCNSGIRFVLLDTGQGIPSTIRKNFSEIVRDLFRNDKNDAVYIAASLQGQFRTETKLEYRGKGLPEIYHTCTIPESHISDLSILSGKGFCKVNKDGHIDMEYVNNKFEGTLLSWIFNKGGIA